MPSDESRSYEATPNTPAREHRPQALAPALSRRRRNSLIRIVSTTAACASLISLSVRLIDRPASTWVHEHLGDSRFAFFTMSYETHSLAIGPFSLMASPAEALGRVAVFVLVILAAAAAAGWRPKRRGHIVLVLSLSILVAIGINREVKSAFGRTWPESWLGDNPSWIRDGVFGFFPFHGGPGWGSFPSGHTAVITTLATLLWLVWPKFRILWVALVAIVITGLVGANYHFISDVIGGIYLGVAIGLGSAGLMLSPKDGFGRPFLRSPAPPAEHFSPVIDESQSTSDHA
jgi:membrane-associated phospholipid phosphatase